MIINNIQELKSIITANVELHRLHDYLRGHHNDEHVTNVVATAHFRDKPVWYTFINSLYSTISLIFQYMKNQQDDINSLDPDFSYTNWSILQCYEHSNDGMENTTPPDLAKILRRLRNSVSHGLYELNTSFDRANDYELVFKDVNVRCRIDIEKNFVFRIKAMRMIALLEKIEEKFMSRY